MTFKMQLTNGTDSIEILNEPHSRAGYYLQSNSYTPQINRRNQTGFGDVYLPVDESFTLTVLGATPNDVHERLAALVNLMDSVQLWDDTDAAAADAVNFIYKPTGSTEAVDYRALVTGGASVNYSQYIEQVGKWFRLPNIQVSFSRGIWLGAEETAVSSTIAQPSVLTATLASAGDLPSPVDIDITFSEIITRAENSVTLVSSAPIVFYEAETSTLTGGLVVLADSYASGGSVVSNNTALSTGGGITMTGAVNFPTNFSIWGVVQNQSTKPVTIKTQLRHSGSPYESTVIIEEGGTSPQIVNLGSFFGKEIAGTLIDALVFVIENEVGAGLFKFDCLAVTPIGGDADGFVQNGIYNFVFAKTKTISIEANVLTDPTGYVLLKDGAPIGIVAFTGSVRHQTIGSLIYTLTLVVGDGVDEWTAYGAVTPGFVNATLTATRRLASLTPK